MSVVYIESRQARKNEVPFAKEKMCMYKKEEKHVIQFNHYHVCYPLNAILDSVKEGVCASQDDVFMVDG